jgi:DNA-binding transcriptional regulator YdaS (Cro superfamily)
MGQVMDQDKQPEETAIKRAVRIAGGASNLARMMTIYGPEGLSRMTVCLWSKPGRRVPAEYCPDIERLTGVPCEELRPDVNWGYLRGTRRIIRSNKVDKTSV